MKSVFSWPVTKDLKQVQSFLGLVQFCRKFIKGFSQLAAPLTYLTRVGQKFTWGQEQQQCFEELNSRITAAPVLKVMDFHPDTVHEVHTDASGVAIGAVLLQKTAADSSFHPVAYFSKKLKQAEQNYSATDREMLAIVEALTHWRHYLHGLQLVVKTDHKPLTFFFSQPNVSHRQLRWSERLCEFMPGLSIQHLSGGANVVPDRLSRRADYLAALAGNPVVDQNVASAQSTFLELLAASQESDSSLAPMWKQARSSDPNFSV